MLGFAFFTVETIEQGTELFDFSAQSEDTHFFLAQGTLQIFQLAQHFPQVTLHRKWAFSALLASSHGDIVEALASLGKKERIGIFERQAASHVRFGNDVA